MAEERPAGLVGLALCLFGFVVCLLLALAPLQRMAGIDPVSHLAPGTQLTWFGSWLPSDFGLDLSLRYPFLTASDLEFHALIVLMFAFYGLGAWLIYRWPRDIAARTRRAARLLIVPAVLLAGALFVVAPGMLSHDIFVYAGYGRVLVAHHANPYFTPLSTYWNDPLYLLDDWNSALAAYGPVWLLVCGLGSLLLGANALGYVVAYRLFALAVHLLNTFLVARILHTSGRSPRTVTLGAFLYALNPLILLESSLGGHNDAFMMTFVLLGALLWVRVEAREGQKPARPSWRDYLPPLLAFTLAALVKFTMLPIIGLFLWLLICRTLRAAPETPLRVRLKAAVVTTLVACAAGGGLALLAYAPFWIGHSLSEILSSFTATPSAQRGQFSILRAIQEWLYYNRTPDGSPGYALLHFFGGRWIWNDINTLVVLICLLVGMRWLWRAPTLATLLRAGLLTLSALLIITPWFFPWYLTWPFALVAAALPRQSDYLGRTLLAFVLTFSLSAFMVYVAQGYRPLGGWYGLMCLTTITPPLLVSAFMLLWPLRGRTAVQLAARKNVV